MSIQPPTSPHEALFAAPERYGFFQAVRLLLMAQRSSPHPLRIDPDKLRFGGVASLAFPPTEIDTLQRGAASDDNTGAQQGPHTLRVNFMGLAGPSGVLPRSYTEWLITLRQARDQGAQDFFDIFNHRLIAMFWQAWARHRPEIGADHAMHAGILRHIFDLVGMGTPHLYKSLFAPGKSTLRTPPGSALGYYSGLVSQRPHGAGSLAQVMSDFLDAPVAVEGCVGTWQRIPPADLTRLGRQATRLGQDCLLGTLFWDRQTTLRLRIGPLRAARFDALMPAARSKPGAPPQLLDQAVELARFLTGLALDLHLQLVLHSTDVPPLTLGPRARRQARLGWNTWLTGRRSRQPADQCEFQFSATGGQSWR